MGQYQAAIISRPLDWKPACSDDVPLELDGPVAVLGQWDDLFEAVARAIEHNESEEALRRGAGRLWSNPGAWAASGRRHGFARRLVLK